MSAPVTGTAKDRQQPAWQFSQGLISWTFSFRSRTEKLKAIAKNSCGRPFSKAAESVRSPQKYRTLPPARLSSTGLGGHNSCGLRLTPQHRAANPSEGRRSPGTPMQFTRCGRQAPANAAFIGHKPGRRHCERRSRFREAGSTTLAKQAA